MRRRTSRRIFYLNPIFFIVMNTHYEVSFETLVNLAAEYFAGKPVLVAGSHAIGNATSDSDVDLMVFTDDVPIPVITCKPLMGLKVEIIEIPAPKCALFSRKDRLRVRCLCIYDSHGKNSTRS